MAQRDETQPEAPDMASVLQLDPDETLTGPSGSDPLDSGYVPPDRPYGVEDNAVTAAGEREGETLEERLRQEVPDGEPGLDERRSGRLVDDVDGAGHEVGVDGGAASAEEAAVHDADAGLEPVVDESPAEDPGVTASLDADRGDPQEAAADAASDADDDPDFGPDA